MRFLVSIVYLAYRLVEKFVIVYTFVFLKRCRLVASGSKLSLSIHLLAFIYVIFVRPKY